MSGGGGKEDEERGEGGMEKAPADLGRRPVSLTGQGDRGFVAPSRTALGGTVNYRSLSMPALQLQLWDKGSCFCKLRTCPKTYLLGRTLRKISPGDPSSSTVVTGPEF